MMPAIWKTPKACCKGQTKQLFGFYPMRKLKVLGNAQISPYTTFYST
jgi:hypothetical protein